MLLSIELTDSQHQQLKSKADDSGLSLEDYVLSRSLSSENTDDEIADLERFLKPRVEAAERGEFSSKSVDDIFDEVIQLRATP